MMNRSLAIIFSFLFVLSCSSVALADVGPCAVFPSDNVWNREIFFDPVHPQSNTFINGIQASARYNSERNLHPDFGENPDYGIPWVTVTNATPTVSIEFDYWEESDVGPYPFYPSIPIEGNGNECGDCHVIAINTDTCMLYETWYTQYDSGSGDWTAGSGAIFDLNSNALRPDTWTSADAAGLPIFPGLVRCEEVIAGEINHAIRFTIQYPNRGYVYPARHYSSNMPINTNRPSYGARARLKADFDLSGFTGQALVIATAMKRYGMILADIGSNWYFQGEGSIGEGGDCWNDDDLSQLKDIPGTAFEFVAYPATTTAAPRTMHFATGTPTLSWSPITWAVEYEIQVDNNSNFSSPSHILSSVTTSVLVDSPALTDGRYYFRIRARRADNSWGSYSVTETFTVDA